MSASRIVRKTPPDEALKIALEHQALVVNMQNSGLALHFVRSDGAYAAANASGGATDQSVPFTTIAALDNATCQSVSNLLRTALINHLADGSFAHLAADGASPAITAPACTDVASCTTLLLQLKATLNAHLILQAPHNLLPASIPLATIVPADAATNITSTNELLLLYQRHFYSAATPIVFIGA